MARWLSGRASDLRSKGRGFEPRPWRCCATTVGKLFTPHALPHSRDTPRGLWITYQIKSNQWRTEEDRTRLSDRNRLKTRTSEMLNYQPPVAVHRNAVIFELAGPLITSQQCYLKNFTISQTVLESPRRHTDTPTHGLYWNTPPRPDHHSFQRACVLRMSWRGISKISSSVHTVCSGEASGKFLPLMNFF